jgi:formylglycine-generating enzyme required for sulfatase activity
MLHHLLQPLNRTAGLLLLSIFGGAAWAQSPMTSFCTPGFQGVIACPCSNPAAGLDRGCDNSSATGGASLSASGQPALAADTLLFTTTGERPTATSIVLQATSTNPTGVAFGQGVRCVSNQLLRLYVKNAVGGSIRAPLGTDLSVSARSAALGDPLAPGTTRHYSVYYRDPIVLGGCAPASTFNSTQSGSLTWYASSAGPVPALVPIPAGTFLMGSTAPAGAPYFGESTTQPVHSVSISYSFLMGATEVTQAQYQALMGMNPSHHQGANNPVEQVSWSHAQAYCAALTTQQAALGNVPAGYQFRLPTEAEWEYACRAGTTTEFHTGTALFCNEAQFSYSYHSNSTCGTTSHAPAGSHSPNLRGLYDMHGNVWEWCLDSWGSYPAGAVTDPFTTGGFARVIRGGSWAVESFGCRSALRSVGNPGDAYIDVGFRVVLGPIFVP